MANMTIYGNTQRNDVIFDYAIIEACCSDNQGVHIKGVRMSEGLLYGLFAILLQSTSKFERDIFLFELQHSHNINFSWQLR